MYTLTASKGLEKEGAFVLELGLAPKGTKERCWLCWFLDVEPNVPIPKLKTKKWNLKFVDFFKGAIIST